MKTRFCILLSIVFLLFANFEGFAQDDVYNSDDKNEKETKEEKQSGKKINTGYVFIDGKYVEPPYVVKNKGMVIYINDIIAIDFQRNYDKQNKNPLANYSERPIVPQNLTDTSTLNDLYKSNDLRTGKPLINAITRYFYNTCSFDVANDSICNFMTSLPNVLKLEKVTDTQFILYLKNGESTILFSGNNTTKNTVEFWKSNNPERKVKKKYFLKAKNGGTKIKEELKDGKVILFCQNCSKEKVITTANHLKEIVTIVNCDLDYNVKIDSLSNYFWGDRKQIEVFLNNFRKSNSLLIRLDNDISLITDKTINQTNLRTKMEDDNNIQKEFLEKSDDVIFYSPSSNSIVGYCPYTWDGSAEHYLDQAIP